MIDPGCFEFFLQVGAVGNYMYSQFLYRAVRTVNHEHHKDRAVTSEWRKTSPMVEERSLLPRQEVFHENPILFHTELLVFPHGGAILGHPYVHFGQ